MKILFVGNTSWTMLNFRGDVMMSLQSSGHEVVVASPRDAGHEELAEKFHFEEIVNLNRKGGNPLHELKLVIELIRLYRRIKPDLIFHYTVKPNVYGGIAAILLRMNYCLMVAGMGFAFGRDSWLRKIVIGLYRLAVSGAYRIIFLNQEDIEDFRSFRIIPRDSKKVMLFPGEGLNMEHFAPQPKMLNESNTTRFIFIGRLLIDKGIREFLNAARKLRKDNVNLIFQVVGPIDLGNPTSISFEELEEFIADGSIEYFGETTDVRPFLRQADALVLPTRYGEGLSRVVLEAMAMEKPVISTDNRGCRQLVIEGVTGMVVPMDRNEDLISVLSRFAGLKEADRKKLGENGRALVMNDFSMSRITALYADLISENVRGPTSHRGLFKLT